MSLVLFVDSETSDLPKFDLPKDDPVQPWITSASAQLCRMDGTMEDRFKFRVRSDGRHIRPGAQAVHGISSRDAARYGMSELTVLGALIGMAAQARYVVGYSVGFDRWVIEANLLRLKKDTRMWTRQGLEFIDLIPPCSAVCKLPTDHPTGTYRWPTLDEACLTILGMPAREGDHDDWDDTTRARLLFFELLRRKHLDLAA